MDNRTAPIWAILGVNYFPSKEELVNQLYFQHAIFNMPNVHDITPLDIFGREIIPAVAAL